MSFFSPTNGAENAHVIKVVGAIGVRIPKYEF
jgi:hypothetical protein